MGADEGGRSLEVWTYSGSSSCSHMRIMRRKEMQGRRGQQEEIYQIKRTRPNTPKFDAIKGGYCVSSFSCCVVQQRVNFAKTKSSVSVRADVTCSINPNIIITSTV